MKLPNDRDDSEKQFFVMFLKLRVPFFADFDKKTLKLIMDRFITSNYKRSQVLAEYSSHMTKLFIVLNGKIGQYDGYKSRDDRKRLNMVYEENQAFGEEGMTTNLYWQSCYISEKPTMLLVLSKKDLIEALSNAKVIEGNNR